MKLFKDQEPEENILNRENFFRLRQIENSRVISAENTHGINISRVSVLEGGRMIDNVDGLLTRDKAILSVTIADCMAIFIFDPEKKAAGIVHAGWRGLARGIGKEAVKRIKEEFGSREKDLYFFVGPHLKNCHFEIKEDLMEEFKHYGSGVIRRGGKYFLDMPAVLKTQLKTAGVPEKNIRISGKCTHCLDSKYFSFRREKAKPLKAMIAYIGIK